MLFSRGTIMVVGTLAGACAGFYALNVASQNRTVKMNQRVEEEVNKRLAAEQQKNKLAEQNKAMKQQVVQLKEEKKREGTSIYLEDYDIALDSGVCVDKLSEVSYFFITHGHFDHIGALCWRARISSKRDLPPATFYIPSSIQDQVELLLNAYSNMGNECLANVISVEADNVIKTLNLTNGKIIKWEAIETDHTVPSQGYLLYNLNDNIPFLAYTGDTLFHSIKENSKILKSKILIMELTFLSDIDYERAELYKHCHSKDIIDNVSLFENEYIIFVHPSCRYNVEKMKDFVRTLPIEFSKKCYCVYSTDIEKVIDE